MKKPINLFLFKAGLKENFGEYLCKKIIHELGFEYNNYSNVRQIDAPLDLFTAIGGWMNNTLYNQFFKNKIKKWYVWGSGVACIPRIDDKLPEDIIQNKCIITMVRGPLTKEYYNIKDDVLVADPGFLASYFFKFPEEVKRNVFIAHHYDNVKKIIDGVDVHLSTLLEADGGGSFDNNFFNVLRNISNANIVLTSSLHACITAHSYGIPWAMVSKRETDIAKEWKWHDVLLSIGIKKEDIKLCNSVKEGLAWWDSVKDVVRPITTEYQEQIIKAFPFEKGA